jgi:hypothetical protein
MKKLFIGCGIVLLLLLCGVGYIVYQILPDVRDLQARMEAAAALLASLETSHPFDPLAQTQLDAPRFALALDVRAGLADDFAAMEDERQELMKRHDRDEDFGALDVVKGMVRTMAPMMERFASRLQQAQMSWPEFSWHTRLMWDCLLRLDAGVGPAELEPLRGAYADFLASYDRARKDLDLEGELPPLPDLIGTFPTPLLNEASALLAQDLDRVQRGLRVRDFDHFFMQPKGKPEEMQGMYPMSHPHAHTPGATEASSPAAPLPAGAPEPLAPPAPGPVPDDGAPDDK